MTPDDQAASHSSTRFVLSSTPVLAVATLLPLNMYGSASATMPPAADVPAIAYGGDPGPDAGAAIFFPGSIYGDIRSGADITPFAYRQTYLGQSGTSGGLTEMIQGAHDFSALMTASALEDPITTAPSVYSLRGLAGLRLLLEALSGEQNEDKRWELLVWLGDTPAEIAAKDRLSLLKDCLHSSIDGDRGAAASALGRLGTSEAAKLLHGRLTVEENSIVSALIGANLKMLERHGSATQTADT